MDGPSERSRTGSDAAAVVDALQRIGNEGEEASGSCIDFVLAQLGASHKGVRSAAAKALAGLLRDGRIAGDAVRPLLREDRFELRWAAAFALHRADLGDDAVAGVALEALGADDGDVRWAAAAIVVAAARLSPGLQQRLRRRAGAASATLRKMALFCLGDCGAEALVFLDALGDADAQVRLAALTVLGRRSERSPEVQQAVAALAASDAEATVRRAATAIAARLAKPFAGS